MKQTLFYGIPGWGFYAGSLAGAIPEKSHFQGLDYVYQQEASFAVLTQILAKKIEKPGTLFAWSLGGLFAIQLASHFPEKVRRIVFYASSPRFLADNDWSGISYSTAQAFRQQAQTQFSTKYKQFVRQVSYPDRLGFIRKQLQKWVYHEEIVLKRLLSILFTSDLRKQYATITVPMLHFIPQNDTILRIKTNQLKKLNCNVKTVILPESGHAGFLTNQTFIQQTISSFLHGNETV